MHTIEFYFLVFLAYSILGWIIEILDYLFVDKRLVNRGFLVGPYCPIYGVGGVAATLLLQKYSDDLVVLFFLGVIIFSVLEYYTSLIMEKIFHARWWDYSKNKFNINGRICLKTMIPFGLLGVVVIRFVNPILFKLINSLSTQTFEIIFLISFTIFIVDLVFSSIILKDVGRENKLLEKDNTDEIKKMVFDKIRSLGWPHRRLLEAFPNITTFIKDTKEFIGDNLKEYSEKQQKIRKKANEKLAKIKTKYDKKIDNLVTKYNKKIMDAEDKK